MPTQAINTIYSLSTQHQKNVNEEDYEILVIENSSTHNLNKQKVLSQGRNVKYFLRNESSQSPAQAINFGLAQAQGDWIGLMIDGARMVTPRVIEYVLMGQRASAQSIVAVPGYNVGPHEQQHHISNNYTVEKEQAMLAATRWKENGYRLFDVSNLSGANPKGAFHPFMECNCLFSSANNFKSIGGADERFNLPGGGSLNLHMYRSLGITAQDFPLFVTPGEGSFHQFHGGITTSEVDGRDEILKSHNRQLHSFWQDNFHSWRKRPTMLGSATSHSLRFIYYSSKTAQIRAKRRIKHQQPLWPDESNSYDES